MLVQFNTDHNLTADQKLMSELEAELQQALGRFSSHLTRVEVYLQDNNADKSGPADKRCTMEARASGQDPFAASHDAPSVMEAFHGARDKIIRMLDRKFEKLRHPKGLDRAAPGFSS